MRKVVLFGSITPGTARADSDIDLALMGLPRANASAMARAAEVAARDVDLVPLEDARPEVIAMIEREGEVIRDDFQPLHQITGPEVRSAYYGRWRTRMG